MFRAGIAPTAILLLWVLPATWGCRYFESSPGPLPDSTLVNVLADLHVAASRAETYGEPAWDWRDSVLATYGVDSTQLKQTLLKHAEEPERFIHLYSAVLDRLNELWNGRGAAPRHRSDGSVPDDDSLVSSDVDTLR